MRKIALLVPLCCLLAGGTAVAQDDLIDLSAQSARADRANRSGRLAPAGQSRFETLRSFLQARHDESTLRDLLPLKEHESSGVEHVTFGQQVAGLDVYGTYLRASFRANGDLVSVVENLVSTARALRPAQVGPEVALRVVLDRFYPGVASPREISSVGNVVTFARVGSLDHEPTVTRTALPLRGRALDSGYLVVTWDRTNQLRHTIVSGRGQILYEQLRTNRESYRIFPNHPGVTPQELVVDPADPLASPLGWLGASTTTTGNNVDAYLDRDNNDAADVGGRPVAPDQAFDFTWDGTTDPTTPTNQQAAVTNLFYLTNLLHDRLYRYGFTESAGNFQTSNFGNGGVENDPLDAEAQDGGGTDNANFATPEDGSRPRMQMYLWDASSPMRDGDLDSDIVYHEYGHGLTWRMIGDMSGAPASAVGEGMSDALATYFNNDDRIAEYSYNNPIGIRSAPYTNYTRTYGLVVGFLGPHLDGEIYAATMWRLRQLWLAQGWSQQTLLRYIVDGMNYTAPKPAYEDMRDGILASMANLPTEVDGEEAACTVWNAFAQFGIGVGADGSEICAIGLCFFRATESFVKPATCASQPPPNTAPTVTINSPAGGTIVTAGTTVSFAGTASDTQDGVLTSGLVWTSSLQGQIGTGGSFSRNDLVVGTHVVTASVTDSGNLTGSATVTIVVNPAPNTPPTVAISAPASGTVLKLGTSVTFTGTATDAQDGNIASSLIWTSDIQGQIGTGPSFSRSDLVAGTHIITARATDSGQLAGSAQVSVTMVNITLNARAYRVKNARKVDLTWGGATTSSVTIYRNNQALMTTPNDGLETDSVARAGTYSYRVCNAGSTTLCSNTVSVTF
jgi:extracellular elastinolytic metalloproteinase